MEVLKCPALLYAENSCHSQEKSVMEFVQDSESNSVKHAEQISVEEKEVDHFLPSLKVAIGTMQCDGQDQDGEALMLEERSNGSSHSGSDLLSQNLSGVVLDHDDDNLEEQVQYKETYLDFQNSHVDVNTIESEPHSENKEDESLISATRWPEQDESLALWVKWRGKWQAGIKCERADWPLATVKAKPTHDRKSYIVIFFPHKKNYSWADTLLVCAIDELPQPIVHRSHKVGVQMVEDLTVARRFIMKKLVIGILSIVDQLPVQVLLETARDVVVWRDFAAEASRCKSYPDLGRLLLKLQNMVLRQYIDANWLQHSFQLWVDKCQNAVSADSIELLKEELVNSILWSEVNDLRDAQGQPALGSEWKMWKHEVMRSFSMTQSVSGGGGVKQPSKNGIEDFSVSPPMTSLQISRKRPKLEVRRAEPHNSVGENKSCQENTIVEINSAFFSDQSTMNADNALLPPKEDLLGQTIAQISSPSNAIDGWDGDHGVVVDTLNAESTQKEDSRLQPVNGVVETKSPASRVNSRKCIAFIEAKGRRCVRWANDGDEYCCVHLMSRFATQSVKTETSTPAESSMCQGTTTQGTRCKHRSLPGTSFCKKHRPHGDGTMPPSSPGSQLKRKHDELLDKSENTCKDIVIAGRAERPLEGHLNTLMEGTTSNGGELELIVPEQHAEDSNNKNVEIAYCVGLGMHEGHSNCLESPKRHSLYCDKHIPSWLKRARNGKSRIISKEVFVDLLRTCSSQKQKTHLHQACERFYNLLKNLLSLRNQVPKETQFQLVLSEASKDIHTAELLMKLVSREKERLTRIWGFNLEKDAQVSCSPVEELALVPVEEEAVDDGSFKCKICFEEFSDDQTLGTHWIDSHNKEAQWLFRGYACAICLDSFTNRKVLETHVQERHHAQFVEHCMLIQCIPCGSHFGNSEELWSHVLSAHTEGFRQSNRGHNGHQLVGSQQNLIPSTLASVDNSESQSSIRKFICRFCGLKFDLLPDLGRHHQAAHMGPGLVSSHPKKKGLRFYAYRLKSGRLSRPRFKKGLSGASYRLRNKGSLVLKKRLQPVNPIGAGQINVQSHVMDTAGPVRLTEAQCSAIAQMLSSEAQKTRARPSNNEILSIACSACCKVSVQRSLEQKYGELPERLYLKAAKLCSEHNTPVDWHQEGFNCSKGCKPQEDYILGSVLSCPINECGRLNSPSPNPQEECEMDECHFVMNPQYFSWRHLQTTIILCDDISFGKEKVSVPCVVDKNLLDSLHNPTYDFDGQAFFMPWESFTYATKPLLDISLEVNMQNLQLGCGCSQSTCYPETCDHVYLFNNDFEYAKDIDGKLMEGRFPYDDKGQLVLKDNYLIYECNNLCKCSSNCPNRVLQNGVRVKMEVFKTLKKGWALRAGEKILRGTFVCEFVGEVLNEQEVDRRRKRCKKEGRDYIYDMGTHMKHMSELIEGEAKYFIDATKYGNVSRFINHSCCPNLESHLVLVESMDFQLAHVGFYAKQDIAAGEELCFDFHYELLAGDGCPCLCGASTCRGRLH
ncbi:histone-lysine N-methyltransferase SUVR5-like isoform X1 [Chenopodium quinoa]|uniref:histone-lysine N-methyltransferase SUVR5-like isoform X1 n=1 Tax=Chenopodium quinoa TaxID=63459 RepID=UPI000B7834C0|nr:histone-lysine N-methyltransferase SUVR5-like isoform X1 [Chenopodium quinoa]XP_021718539.1 histone-lysine N-methyltransferase SUVR5-like isoform X1 [Chenopodium quinoa]XP_021718540.1 histone-lysine N-methyltransferase SUVR5-like isoform X1 [Chenopodium quinoa]